MSPGSAMPRFHESRREGMPTDVGLFWEPDLDDLARRLHDSEADRALRLARLKEVWADRTAWIDRYNEMDVLCHEVARERDAALRDFEADRASQLARMEEIWADRTAWIDRYNEMDALHHALARERDALIEECRRLQHAVVQARDLRAREQHHLAQERAAADAKQAVITSERDGLAAERAKLLAECAALRERAAAIEADRGRS